MPNIGPAELILILAIALIVFGPKKLPEIGKGIGSALREFNKARNDLMDSLHAEVDRDEPVRRSPAAIEESSNSYDDGYQSMAPEGTAHRAEAPDSHETESADALPYGSDFHAVEGDSQPSFRSASQQPMSLASGSTHSGQVETAA